MKIRAIPSILVGAFVACSILGCSQAPVAAPLPEATIAPTAPPENAPLPLSGPGPFRVGWKRMVELGDADRKVTLTLWYPAVGQTGAEPSMDAESDAAPDLTGAPYPLILTATKLGFAQGFHLASHGYVVAGVNGQDSMSSWGPWLTDHPRELLFALDQITEQGVTGLEGMIETENVGAMGYSFGSPTALLLGGARVDPENYLRLCADAPVMTPPMEEWWIDYYCKMLGGWDAFVANAGAEITASQDGLWAPITDDRIRAVMPMAPEGDWLFGKRGLAFVDRPTLILSASQDTVNPYTLEAIPIYDKLPPAYRSMISFVGEGHMMIYRPARLAQMEHFAAAFFGYHLKGDAALADYFSEDFVASHSDLAWGVFRGE